VPDHPENYVSYHLHAFSYFFFFFFFCHKCDRKCRWRQQRTKPWRSRLNSFLFGFRKTRIETRLFLLDRPRYARRRVVERGLQVESDAGVGAMGAALSGCTYDRIFKICCLIEEITFSNTRNKTIVWPSLGEFPRVYHQARNKKEIWFYRFRLGFGAIIIFFLSNSDFGFR